MQLVAYGAQDVYLTGNPQITFWKVTYRRHTNFAMESIEQTFNGQADFGRRVQCTVSRNGDLAYRTYLQVTLPEVNQADATGATQVFARWLDNPGEQMVSMVEVEIGGQRIDRQYGDWMHIWNQLTLTSEQESGYHKMIGQTTQLTYLCDPGFAQVATACGAANVPEAVCAPRQALPETTLYIPLQFWFCRNPGLALPLIALQYHEVKINIEIRPLDECLFAVTGVSASAGTTSVKVANAYAKSLVAASLYVDYVFLDTDERRRMAQNPHEYLIEQVQQMQIEMDEPRAGEVLVQMRAVGICHTDLGMKATWSRRRLPQVFGHEGAGVVAAVGPDVTGLQAGQTVSLTFRSCFQIPTRTKKLISGSRDNSDS